MSLLIPIKIKTHLIIISSIYISLSLSSQHIILPFIERLPINRQLNLRKGYHRNNLNPREYQEQHIPSNNQLYISNQEELRPSS